MAAKKKSTEGAIVPIQSATDGMIAIGEYLKTAIVSPDATVMATAFATVKNVTKLLEQYEEIGKKRVIDLLKTVGQVATDKGTRKATIGNFLLEMRPTRTGFDPKKVESLIRAKEMDPAKYMNTKITYEVDEQKLVLAMDKKVFTKDELETCRYAESWTVQSPKTVGE